MTIYKISYIKINNNNKSLLSLSLRIIEFINYKFHKFNIIIS